MDVAEEDTVKTALAVLAQKVEDLIKVVDELKASAAKAPKCPDECLKAMENHRTRIDRLEATHNKITEGASAAITEARSALDERINSEVQRIWNRLWWAVGVGITINIFVLGKLLDMWLTKSQ